MKRIYVYPGSNINGRIILGNIPHTQKPTCENVIQCRGKDGTITFYQKTPDGRLIKLPEDLSNEWA